MVKIMEIPIKMDDPIFGNTHIGNLEANLKQVDVVLKRDHGTTVTWMLSPL